MQRILVLVDDNEQITSQLISRVKGRADDATTVLLLYVDEPDEYRYTTDVESDIAEELGIDADLDICESTESLDLLESDAKETAPNSPEDVPSLQNAINKLEESDIECHARIISGPIVETVVETADLFEATTIYLSSRDRTGTLRPLWGGETQAIMNHPDTDQVTIVGGPLEPTSGDTEKEKET